jgi:flagellar motility protein MotE (MotC chaperone)
VARPITACREGAQERLRVAEWARVEAQARAEEQERRRRVADQLPREAGAREKEDRKRRRLTMAGRLRDMDALAKIAEDEQKTWRALWAQVVTLLAKTCQSNSP